MPRRHYKPETKTGERRDPRQSNHSIFISSKGRASMTVLGQVWRDSTKKQLTAIDNPEIGHRGTSASPRDLLTSFNSAVTL